MPNFGLLQPIQQVAQPMQGSAPSASAPAIRQTDPLQDLSSGFLNAYQQGQQIQQNDQAMQRGEQQLKIGDQVLQQETLKTDEAKTQAEIAKATRDAATKGVEGLLQYYDSHDPVNGAVFRKQLSEQQQTEANAQKADAEAYGSSIKVRGDFVGIVNQGRNDEEKAQIWQIQRSGMPDSVKKLVPEKYTPQAEQAMMSILSFAHADYMMKHPETKQKASSSIGKLQEDAQRLRDEINQAKQQGRDTTQLEKNLVSLESAEKGDGDEKKFTQATTLRKEYVDQTKDFRLINDAYGRIQASAKDPSAAGDLALVFNYMKMLDPGSTVREGEFATAQNSAGIPDIIRAKYNKIQSGERLSTSTREDFVKRSDMLYKSQSKGAKQIEEDYKKRAIRAGLNPEDVIVEARVPGRDQTASDPSQEDLEYTAKKHGMTVEQVKAKLAGGK